MPPQVASMRNAGFFAAIWFASTNAWHLQVHNQIAFMAERLLQPETLNITAQLLDPKYSGSIGRAAGWADTVRKIGAPYSYNWHFIGMKENITNSNCSNDWKGVCEGGDCVVAQIANQTSILEDCAQQVRDGDYKPNVDCQQALMWVVHFIGDVAQPLHTSNTAQGGNLVKVTFNGTATNLHDVWDRQILYSGTAHPYEFSDQQLDLYFANLLGRIEKDSFNIPRKDWSQCAFDIGKDNSCPKLWAEDSHALVCTAAYSRLMSNTTDLMYNGYAKEMFPTVELQLAKAAWRMAGWLNSLVVGTSGKAEDTPNEQQQVLSS